MAHEAGGYDYCLNKDFKKVRTGIRSTKSQISSTDAI